MTRDEIISMAREACGPFCEDPLQESGNLILSPFELGRFAALVRTGVIDGAMEVRR